MQHILKWLAYEPGGKSRISFKTLQILGVLKGTPCIFYILKFCLKTWKDAKKVIAAMFFSFSCAFFRFGIWIWLFMPLDRCKNETLKVDRHRGDSEYTTFVGFTTFIILTLEVLSILLIYFGMINLQTTHYIFKINFEEI